MTLLLNAACVIPLVVATGMIVLKRNNILSMGVGLLIGTLLVTATTSKQLIGSIITTFCIIGQTMGSNIEIFINVVLLSILVSLIISAGLVESLTSMLQNRSASKTSILAATVFTGVLAGLDDYMGCLAGGGLVHSLAKPELGLKKERLGAMVNTISVSMACLVPLSTWGPVVVGNLKSSLGDSNLGFAFILNFSAWVGVAVCILLAIQMNKKTTIQSKSPTARTTNVVKNNRDASILILSITVLVLVFILLNVIKAPMPLAFAAMASIGIICIGARQRALVFIKAAFASIIDIGKLVAFLITAWSLVDLCIGLGLNEWAHHLFTALLIPLPFLPVAIFICAALFSFFTGSAFTSMSLFIPLAAAIAQSAPAGYTPMTIAAAIAGSLFSACSYASDTLGLTANATKTDMRLLRREQFKLSGCIGVTCLAGFYMLGLTQSLTMSILIIGMVMVASMKLLYRAQSENAITEATIRLHTVHAGTKLTSAPRKLCPQYNRKGVILSNLKRQKSFMPLLFYG